MLLKAVRWVLLRDVEVCTDCLDATENLVLEKVPSAHSPMGLETMFKGRS